MAKGARVAHGVNAEIWFPAQERVSVFLESSVPSGDGGDVADVALSAYFFARMVANLGNSPGCAAMVRFLSQSSSAEDVESTVNRLLRDNDVKRVPPDGGRGRKGFTASLRPDERSFFKCKLHGFGILGRGSDFYAPMAVMALLSATLEKHQGDQKVVGFLAAVTQSIAWAGCQGRINAVSQYEIADQAIAGAANSLA
jgi:hypothetical protein